MSRSPDLAEAILETLDRAIRQIFVWRPGQVLKYDAATQLAQVQPLIMGVKENEDGSRSAFSMAPIHNVPVVFLGGGGFRATFPVKVGDIVILLAADRSLDVWKSKRGEVDPVDIRAHQLQDSIAIAGLQIWGSAPTDRATFGSDSGARVEVMQSQIDLNASTVNVGAGASQAVILGDQFLSDFLTLMNTVATQVGTSGNPAGAAAAGAAIAAAIATFSATPHKSSSVKVAT